MRGWLLIGVAAFLAASCSPEVAASPSPSPSAVLSASPTASPCSPATSYGLLIADSRLELIDTCGNIAASTPIAPPSAQVCSPVGGKASLAPPASATNDQVFYRDGDTKIRSLTLDGHTADVTSVPGGPTTVSYFSVSPDDQRIAVLVEDLSPANSINLRLYVEDLHGGGHHSDIYSTTQPKIGGTTLWPMGWHQGQLVLALMTACSVDPSTLSPVEWHVADAATGNRAATITAVCGYNSGETLSRWASPAGVVCVSVVPCTYDWSGRQTACWTIIAVDCQGQAVDSGLSPTGDMFFASPRTTCRNQSDTRVFRPTPDGSGGGQVSGYRACLWIDDRHLLAPNAVITMPADLPMGIQSFPITAVSLPSGTCAGRFPGGL